MGLEKGFFEAGAMMDFWWARETKLETKSERKGSKLVMKETQGP